MELMSTNPGTVALFTVKIVDLSVTLSFYTAHREFILNGNLQKSDRFKA